MRYCGNIGYAETVEVKPGVWVEQIMERPYRGDVTKQKRDLDLSSDEVNSSPVTNNTLSIVADAYAYDHYYAMRYAEIMGAKWQVKSVTVSRPRLELTLGGLYHDADAI